MKRFGFFILFAWLALTFWLLDSAPAPRAWAEWPPDYCRSVNCYCEPIRDRLVAQPLASYSNLGLLGVGLAIVWATFRRPPPTTQRLGANKAYGLIYGLALLGTGLGSFFYHASLTRLGDYFDLMGMYLFASFLMLYSLTRLYPISSIAFMALYLALNATLSLGLIVAYELQQVYFGVLIVGLLLAEVWLHHRQPPQIQLRYLGAALACFGLGAAVWILDGNSILPCAPTAPLTWHAIWHLSVAASAGLMYLYYRSERAATGNTSTLPNESIL